MNDVAPGAHASGFLPVVSRYPKNRSAIDGACRKDLCFGLWTLAELDRLRLGTRRFCHENDLNLFALKGEDSQATLRITTLTLAPEGSHRPHVSGFRRGLTPSQQPFMCLGFRSS